MEDDNLGPKPDMHVMMVHMAPEVSISAAAMPISFTTLDSHRVVYTKCLTPSITTTTTTTTTTTEEDGSHGLGFKLQSGDTGSKQPPSNGTENGGVEEKKTVESVVACMDVEKGIEMHSVELPSKGIENGGVDRKTVDYAVGSVLDAEKDIEMHLVEEPDQTSSTPHDNNEVDNGPIPDDIASCEEETSATSITSLDDDQPLCLVLKKGKSGEQGLMALAERKTNEDVSNTPLKCPHASLESLALEVAKPSSVGLKSESGRRDHAVVANGDGGDALVRTLKTKLSNGVERGGKKGSMELRRAPRQVKKRRYFLVWTL